MRQCSPPVMAGGSRPKRALTIRATWPAGTIGTVGVTVAVVGACGGGGAAGGGNAAGCTEGGASTIGLAGAAPDAGGGASTPDGAPGGIRFWPDPIEPGGRGMDSKPGGVDCANAGPPGTT